MGKEAAKCYPPIDLVYTWVDGSDPQWLKNKKRYLKKENPDLSNKSFEQQRYRNLNELKYSLRSAEKFAPFIRKIFIVTASQCPKWLNQNHPKIQIIDHSEIFPHPQNRYLPTFNSIAIEMNLHRIPDLAEHFIYFNDDVFFGRRVTPEHFLTTNGKTKIFIRNQKLPTRQNIDPNQYYYRDSMYYTHKFLNRYVKFEKKRLTIQHVGYLMKKSVLSEIEQLLREHNHFDKSCTRFRKNCNINLVPFFYPHYSLIKNNAVPVEQGKNIQSKSISVNHELHYDKLLKQKPHLYCLNGLSQKTPELKKFWKKYYPDKSQFEL